MGSLGAVIADEPYKDSCCPTFMSHFHDRGPIFWVAVLQWARQLQSKMDELFWDEVGGGYFNTAAGARQVVHK